MPKRLESEKLKAIVESRRLQPPHVLFATFLSALAENGVLNQGLVNLIARQIAPVILEYLKAMNAWREVKEGPAILSEELEVNIEDNTVTVGLGGVTCRYCPRG